MIELQNLLLEAEQLSTERGKARAGNLWHPRVLWVGNNMQQVGDPSMPDRRDNANLRTFLSFHKICDDHIGSIIGLQCPGWATCPA